MLMTILKLLNAGYNLANTPKFYVPKMIDKLPSVSLLTKFDKQTMTDPTLQLVKAELNFRKHIMDELYEPNKEIIESNLHEKLKFEYLKGEISGLQLSVIALEIRQKTLDQLEKITKKLFFLVLLTVCLTIFIQVILMIRKGFSWDAIGVCIWAFVALTAYYSPGYFKKKK